MKRCCPCCGLPRGLPARAYAVTSNDGQRHAVVGICQRCVDAEVRLPRSARQKRINRAATRALGDPARYYCTMYADPATASMAVGMLGVAGLCEQTVEALGWVQITHV